MELMGDQAIKEPPSYGLKLSLDHEYSVQSKQSFMPPAKAIIELMPLTARYLRYYVHKKMTNKRPIMDYIHLIHAQRMYGCPIGGIGGGTIGRGFKGEFCRFQLTPGLYEYVTVPECQFIVNIRNAEGETIFQSVLSSYEKPKKAPASWEWNLDSSKCEYTGLYPRAWTVYDLTKYGIKLSCRQISPVIPHNYKDSSLPCAVFVWSAQNVSNEHRNVSITFTWTEVLAPKKKPYTKSDIERYSEENTCGVTLEQQVNHTPCSFTIAKAKQDNETIHEGYCTFNAARSSDYVWKTIKKHGKLQPDTGDADKQAQNGTEQNGKEKGGKKRTAAKPNSIGLSSVLSLDPGGSDTTEFCLAWDMPVIKYKTESKGYKRFYTRFFGSDGIAGASIAAYALKNYKRWEKQICDWQDPILNNSHIPDWLKSALMNELYYVADGGTVWFDVQDDFPETDPRHHFGLFGYLEGHEYRMYNTYDVHFYGSFALAQLWPNLQVVLQYMFRDTIALESEKSRKSLYDGKFIKYKIKNSIPHDLGDPDDEPFTRINAYNIHDVSEWRDLNVKYVLQVMRDYHLLKTQSAPFGSDRSRSMEFIDDVRAGTENELYMRSTGQADNTPRRSVSPPARPVNGSTNGVPHVGNILEMLYRNEEQTDDTSPRAEENEDARSHTLTWDGRRYVADMYDTCAALVRRSREWDVDGDGLIENTGWPDQTYDTWVMTGPSAYCGGLWLAALASVREMARILGREEDAKEFGDLLEKGKASFDEKLWCDAYYRFDTLPANERVIMSDQLAGQWYLRAAGINEEVFPEEKVKKALRTIYENNVLKFNGGRMGAVNGFILGKKNRAGHVDHTTLQSEEMWTGVTYGLTALMVFEGMHEEAFATAGGMCKSLVEMGLSFETPEALFANGNHRSVAYMRPLAVWGVYQAISARPPSRRASALSNGTAKNGGT